MQQFNMPAKVSSTLSENSYLANFSIFDKLIPKWLKAYTPNSLFGRAVGTLVGTADGNKVSHGILNAVRSVSLVTVLMNQCKTLYNVTTKTIPDFFKKLVGYKSAVDELNTKQVDIDVRRQKLYEQYARLNELVMQLNQKLYDAIVSGQIKIKSEEAEDLKKQLEYLNSKAMQDAIRQEQAMMGETDDAMIDDEFYERNSGGKLLLNMGKYAVKVGTPMAKGYSKKWLTSLPGRIPGMLINNVTTPAFLNEMEHIVGMPGVLSPIGMASSILLSASVLNFVKYSGYVAQFGGFALGQAMNTASTKISTITAEKDAIALEEQMVAQQIADLEKLLQADISTLNKIREKDILKNPKATQEQKEEAQRAGEILDNLTKAMMPVNYNYTFNQQGIAPPSENKMIIPALNEQASYVHETLEGEQPAQQTNFSLREAGREFLAGGEALVRESFSPEVGASFIRGGKQLLKDRAFKIGAIGVIAGVGIKEYRERKRERLLEDEYYNTVKPPMRRY